VLHLFSRLEMIVPRPLGYRDAHLIFTKQPGQTLVGDGDSITGQQFLLYPNAVAPADCKEFSDALYMLVIGRFLIDCPPDIRRLEHLVYCIAGDLELSGNQSLFDAVAGHFLDHLFLVWFDHRVGTP